MKLPGIQYTQGVKPLVVAPSGAKAVLAEGRAIVETAKVFSELAMDVSKNIAEERANEKFADAALAMQTSYAKAMTTPNALDSPGVFNAEVESMRVGAKKDLDSLSYKKFKSKFDIQAQAMEGKLVIESTFRANKEQRERTSTKSKELARAGEVDNAVSLVEDSILYSDAEKEDLYKEIGHQQALGAVEAASYSNDPDVIMGELDDIKSPNYIGPLEGRERDAAVSSLETAYKDSVAAIQEKIAHDRGRILGNLALNIKTGKAGPQQIEEAYNDYPEFITPAKREQFILLHNTVATKRQEQMVRKINVRQALAMGEPLDPKDNNSKKGVDEVFADEPTLMNGVDLAIKTNIMPSQLKADFRRLAIAGNPQRVLEIANAFEVLERENPITIDDIGSKQVAIYTTVAQLVRGGVPLSESVEVARKNAAMPPEERQQFRTNLKLEEYTPSERLQKAMDASDLDVSWWPTGAPDPSPAMQAAYASMEAEYYTLMGGDVEMAEKAAFKHMLRVYSTSDINGENQVMAYAPDRVTRLPTNFLRKQLISSTRKLEDMKKVLPKNIFIVSDSQTAREQGIKSYPVHSLNKFGLPEPVLDVEGKQFRWTPKVGKYKEHLKIQRGKALAKEKVGMRTPGKEQQFLFGAK